LIVFVGFVFLVLFYQLNPKAPKLQTAAPADSSVAGVNPLGMDEDEFVDEGPAIHEDNEDLEVFRPIVPPLKGEEEEIELEPVLAEMPVEAMEEEVLPALEDLDFTYKVAVDADIPEEEEDTTLAGQEIKANDLVEQFGLYDPTADLPKYQYPTIDLLKEYDQKIRQLR